jgi:hypothetical protein
MDSSVARYRASESVASASTVNRATPLGTFDVIGGTFLDQTM